MTISTMHLVAIMCTIIISIGYAIYSARNVKSAEGFSLLGRTASAPLVAGGIAGVIIGGGATVGTAQMAFQVGLSAWAYTLGAGLAFIIQGLFYARPLRNTELETIPQFFALHFGKAAGPVVSFCTTLSMLCGAVAGVVAGIQIIAVILNIPHLASTFILTSLVIATVFFSGQKGNSVSGIVKMVILWITLCIGGIIASIYLNGMPSLSAVFPKEPWFNLFGLGVGEGLGNLFSMIVGILCSQSYIQALYSASNARTASIGAFMAAGIIIPIGLPTVAIGMFMHANQPDIQSILALPTFLLTYMPGWLGGVAVAGILLAIIGSTAGQALGMGTLISRDFVANVFRVSSEKTILWANRITIISVSVIVSFVSYMYLNATVLEWNYMSMILRGGGIFIPLTLAIYLPGRLKANWAVSSIILSTTIAIIAKIVLKLPVNPLYLALAVSAVIIIVGILVSKDNKGDKGGIERQ